jgi:phenylpropionate dioxygenase-like ring-hydroxylating dioxygenase large terminal subunit
MDADLLARLKSEMHYEFSRTGPPEGFPAFHDIPGGRYTSDEFWELEQTKLWPRVWAMACRADEVAKPGDYKRFDDLGVPLVIVRSTTGDLRAYYNTCQHRGAPVVRDECGSARQLRCQYHSWTYDIDSGTLVSIPDERDFVGLDKAERCLPTVRCEVWDGWVFVNQDPNAKPLLETLSPIPQQLAEMGGTDLKIISRRSEVVTCNWKVMAEGFLEVYHFRHIHSRNGDSLLDNRGATMGLLPGGHSRMVTPFAKSAATGFGMSDWSDWQKRTVPGFIDIDSVNPMIRSTSSAYSIFPNLITPLASYGFPFLLFWPLAKDKTRLDWIHYGPKDWDGDELPPQWERRMETFDQIMEEDTRNLGPMQRSLESPALKGIPINYQERRIWHLHEEIDRTIGVEHIPQALRMHQVLAPYVER